jgi:anion-transporting  ArsA/GET3 family ATPase
VKNLIQGKTILIVLGPGGVGKTTISAALGIAAAQAGFATGVITVDPARRLRDALGIRQLGARARAVSAARLSAAGLDPKLKIAALALDVKLAWDSLIERLLPEPDARARILANPFYRNLTEHFAGAESYAALEQLLVLYESGEYSLQVVDTPPAEHVFDFIEAPGHLLRLLDSPTARWLARLNEAGQAGGLRIANRAGRMVLEQLENAVGGRPLSSMADFLEAVARAREGIAERMRAAEALIRSPQARFVLVTTPAEDRLEEAKAIAQRMKKEGLHLGAIAINRAVASYWPESAAAASQAATETLREIEMIQRSVCGARKSSEQIEQMLELVGARVREQSEALERIKRFSRAIGGRIPIVALPEAASPVRDLKGLGKLAGRLRPLVSI